MGIDLFPTLSRSSFSFQFLFSLLYRPKCLCFILFFSHISWHHLLKKYTELFNQCAGRFFLDSTFLRWLIVIDRIDSGVLSEQSVSNPHEQLDHLLLPSTTQRDKQDPNSYLSIFVKFEIQLLSILIISFLSSSFSTSLFPLHFLSKYSLSFRWSKCGLKNSISLTFNHFSFTYNSLHFGPQCFACFYLI